MTDKDNGGPAFAAATSNGYQRGMSLRDWYAGMALQGLCANSGGPYQANDINGWSMVNCNKAEIAEEAYNLADAMIEAREK